MSRQRDAGNRHSQLLGTREGSGFSRRGLRVGVTALTDSLDGIPENPATRGNPHREGAGGNPSPRSPGTPFLSPALLTPVSPLISTYCRWEDTAALVLSKSHLRQINTKCL